MVSMEQFTLSKVTSTLFIIGATILLFTISYIIYSYISNKLANKVLWLVPESKVPILGTSENRISGEGIPTKLNGNRLTFMFWIYINDINEGNGQFKHVLHRGDKSTANASPLVMLDKTESKLYIRFSGSKRGLWNRRSVNKNWSQIIKNYRGNFYHDSDALAADLTNHGIIVDYVPIQRWVHIAVVVNETINQGEISLYMDGELVKHISSNDTEKINDHRNLKLRYEFLNLDLNKVGDIYVGGDETSENIGFSGLVGNIAFANYDMNARSIHNEYTKGPVDNLASKLGLPAYGVRSPVYRLG